MRVLMFFLCALVTGFVATASARADLVLVSGGQSNLYLDPNILAVLGITVQGTSGTVPPAPGFTVAYPISSRDANPGTTFSYDPKNFFGTFSGVIEHTGTITLQAGAIPYTLGDFTVAYDAARADAVRSGFYIDDNRDLNAPLFDIAAAGATIDATSSSLKMNGDLLLSLEAATGFGNSNIAGLNVGKGFVDAAAVPEPSSMLMLSGVVTAGAIIARRRKKLAS